MQKTITMYCTKCAYILNYLDTNRCPECGTQFDPQDPTSYLSTKPKRQLGYSILWLLLAIIGITIGGDSIWGYIQSSSRLGVLWYYCLPWGLLWLALAIFAILQTVNYACISILITTWLDKLLPRFVRYTFYILWITGTLHILASGPLAVLYQSKIIDNKTFTFLYLPVLAQIDSRTPINRLIIGYMNLCSKPAMQRAWSNSFKHEKVGEFQKAIDAISNLPENPSKARRLSYLYIHLNNLDLAMDQANFATLFDMNNPASYICRSEVNLQKGEIEKALSDCDIAITLSQQDYRIYYQKSRVYKIARRWNKALEQLKLTIGFKQDHSRAHNSIAWLLATCLDDDIRNGVLAVKHGRTACELTQWRKSAFVDTLAASYAEMEEFDKAIEMLDKAIKLDSKLAIEMRIEMMDCFKADIPYRAVQKDR